MPSSDSLYQSIGGSTFPVDPDLVSASVGLADLDKARDTLTELFKSAINSELTTIWQTAASGTILADTLPVQDTFKLTPNKQAMQQRKAAFPLLSVHRAGEGRFEEHTLSQDKLVQQWDVDYVVGPLDIAALYKLENICHEVAKVLRLVIRQRGHRSYQDGVVQFFGDTCGICGIELQSFSVGQATFAGDDSGTLYYGMTAKLETTELTADDLEAFGLIDSMTVTVDAGDDTGLVPALVIGDSSALG